VKSPSYSRTLAHFLLLGILLLGVRASGAWLFGEGLPHWFGQEQGEIWISERDIDVMRHDFRRRFGVLPGDAELAELLEHEVDHEILFREALRLRLHRSDPTVRRRLIANARFTGLADHSPSDALGVALALGMERTDPVVRRRLIQRAIHLVVSAADLLEADESELEAYRLRHPEKFRQPARFRFHQVFLSAARRGDQLTGDAETLLSTMRSSDPSRAVWMRRSDPFPLAHRLGPWTEVEISKWLGAEAAARIAGLEPGKWEGPIASPYGLHLVRVEEVIPAALPSLAAVRGRVVEACQEERERDALQRGLAVLRRRYTVRIAAGDNLSGTFGIDAKGSAS
jgi:hypothetical protein